MPNRRVELYSECSKTLLALRKREFNTYDRDLKEIILEELAYKFFCKGVDEFPYRQSVEQVATTLGRLGKGSLSGCGILKELCERNGILQESSDKYFFVHRTFYEYYVSCNCFNSDDLRQAIFKNHAESSWEEPIRLYAAQFSEIKQGTEFLRELWKQNRNLAILCYHDMGKVVELDLIKEMIKEGNIEERAELVKGLPEKIEQDKVTEFLGELFKSEKSCEVTYHGIQILEKINTPEALKVRDERLGSKEEQNRRYEKYLKDDMVPIPAGTFIMGSPGGEQQRGWKRKKEGSEDEYETIDDEKLHSIKLDGFHMSKYPVTLGKFKEFIENEKYTVDIDKSRKSWMWSDGKNEWEHKDGVDWRHDVNGNLQENLRHPVVYINWYDAWMFCKLLGCSLPTEAQWEYACRAETVTPFNTGDNLTTKQANYNGNYPYNENEKGDYLGATTPVGFYKDWANKWGLYDMHGNVLEWCLDWYGEKYYNECEHQGIVENPTGPTVGAYRVLHGGSWNNNGQNCRSARRANACPDNCYFNVDFRPVFLD